MNKEHLGLKVFRLLLSLGIFILLCLIYLSSLILEEDSKVIKEKLETIQTQVSSYKTLEKRSNLDENVTEFTKSVSGNPRKHIDPTLPNLLEEDPFFLYTLPKLLGNHFKPHGTLRNASLSKPINLHPFSQWADVIEWTNMCNVAVADSKIGYYETLTPDMAIKMELRKNPKTNHLEYWVHLREGVYFEPLQRTFFQNDFNLDQHFLKKHPVTAYDFKFYYDAIMNPNVQESGAVALRSYLSDIEEFQVLDDLTFFVRWKTETSKTKDGKEEIKPKYIAKLMTGSLRPLARFVYQYFPDGKKIVEEDSKEDFYRSNSIWAQNFSNHFAKNIIVSSGPWIFEGLNDREIKFRRNPDFYNPLRALVEYKIYEFKQSTESIWQEFKSQHFDTYGIQSDQLGELEKFLTSDAYLKQLKNGDAIQRLDYYLKRYVHIQWNLKNPLFQSKKVRQALTMAIDRKRIVKQNLNGMAVEIHGPFFKFSKANNPGIKPWPFDPHRAKMMLEEEGFYDSDGDGIIDKEIDGKRVSFSFKLTYYVKNSLGKAIVEYIATALKEIGIDVRLNGVDVTDLSQTFDDKSFDALFFIWGLGSPPEDPEQLWSSKYAKVKGSSNAIGFSNPEADEIIERLKLEYDPLERLNLYHQFDQIIHEEAPYTFLFTPKASLLYRSYLQNVFIPADRQDLFKDGDVEEPDSSIFWIKKDHV